MMRMASFGKSRRIESSKSMDSPPPLSTPSRKLQTATSEVSRKGGSFITRLASMGSLKSKRTKSGMRIQAHQAPPPSATTILHKCEAAELEMAFKVYDANGDGQICMTELGAVLRSLGGGEISDPELQQIMDDVDKNRDGFISLDEFKEVHEDVGEDHIREAFVMFDRDGNNLICADELRAVMRSLGERGHSLEDCRRMIRSVDRDGDGFVDFKEFQHLLSAKS